MVTFTKKPTHYGIDGTPIYLSICGAYRLLHRRHGVVLENGKAQIDYWDLQALRSKNDWVVVCTRYPTKSEAKKAASVHKSWLVVQLKMDKHDSSNARSSKASARRSKNASARGTKRNKGKRKVSKASNRRDD